HGSTRNLVGHLIDLLRSNLAQWNWEDEARRAGADDAAVAEAKRAIDQLNAGRHHLVEEIDAAVDRTVGQTASAPLATESPGMAFDRLSVLVIRIQHTERAAAADASSANPYAARLPVLSCQLADLQRAIDGLLADVRDGTRRFVPYQSLKMYGP
ncbi:MAG TPA: DUF4254 domain-containing protein, partial [Acidimicrobiia bacterium]